MTDPNPFRLPPGALLASNTSSLSITELGEATTRPEKVVGLHFFHPPSAARLVEVIEGDDTSPDTVQAAHPSRQRTQATRKHRGVAEAPLDGRPLLVQRRTEVRLAVARTQ